MGGRVKENASSLHTSILPTFHPSLHKAAGLGVSPLSMLRLRAPLVLASQSPRRRDLLAPSACRSPSTRATPTKSGPTGRRRRGRGSARAAEGRSRGPGLHRRPHAGRRHRGGAARRPGEAPPDAEVLGKPTDEAHARATLERLSGRTHQVYSGLALVHPASGRTVTAYERTSVTFALLTATRSPPTSPRAVRWTKPAPTASRTMPARCSSPASTATTTTSSAFRCTGSTGRSATTSPTSSSDGPRLRPLRVLLIQIRERPAVIAEEQASFRERCASGRTSSSSRTRSTTRLSPRCWTTSMR